MCRHALEKHGDKYMVSRLLPREETKDNDAAKVVNESSGQKRKRSDDIDNVETPNKNKSHTVLAIMSKFNDTRKQGAGAVIFAIDSGFARDMVKQISLLGLRVDRAGYNEGEDSKVIIQGYMDGELDVLILSYRYCFGLNLITTALLLLVDVQTKSHFIQAIGR